MKKENFEFMLKRLRVEIRYANRALNSHKADLFDQGKTDKFLDFEERMELVKLQSQYDILREIIIFTQNEMDGTFGKTDFLGEIIKENGENNG